MKRRLVKQGTATMMVSLPSKWIKHHGLEKGDEVEVISGSQEIRIIPKGEYVRKKTHLNITQLTESSVRTLITNAYRAGYDAIEITFNEKDVLPVIQSIIDSRLLGFEIIKTTSKSCTIENITEPSKEQFENILNKVFLNIDELFVVAKDALRGKAFDVEGLEGKIQQFDNFCRRVIAKHNATEVSQLQWAFHSELIHGQREIYHMLRYLKGEKKKTDSSVIALLDDCRAIYQNLFTAFKEHDITLLEKIHLMEKDILYKKGYALLRKNNASVVAHHIINAARNFYLATSPLMGVFIARQEK